MLRFLTAGESHGQALLATLEGLPAGIPIDTAALMRDLRRRQLGYGRGRRMQIETDTAEILSGVRKGVTLGSPVAMLIRNRDWKNWQQTMHVEAELPAGATGARRAPVTRPRPGHADLAGALKYDREDMRDVLERASARETAARVAVGALARQFLAALDIHVASHVFTLGPVSIGSPLDISFEDIAAIDDDAPLHCVDAARQDAMIAAVDAARAVGDTLGGAFEVVVRGVPPGLGSYVQWDRKLDGRLAQAVMSIPAIKAVGIGKGVGVADVPGSQVHDEIVLPAEGAAPRLLGVSRPTNNAGGLEGGVTNGEDLRLSGYMKPISTLMRPLRSVDLQTMQESPAAIERSDVCAVPAAAVVAEAMIAFVLADALLERFGGDTLTDIRDHVARVHARVQQRFASTPARA